VALTRDVVGILERLSNGWVHVDQQVPLAGEVLITLVDLGLDEL